VKHLCVADTDTKIWYASRHYPGKTHDKVMLEEESKRKKLPQKIQKLFDLAFLGLESEYENVIMPKKKPKGRELTERQKNSNKKISSVRVKIENAFAGVKRLRIVYNVSRTRRDIFIDQTFLVACGLWNYYLANK
jgi:hypothetical protein